MDPSATKLRKITWIKDNLSSVLGFSIEDELIMYINTIRNERDFTEFFSTILDPNIPDHAKFLVQLKQVLLVGEIPKDTNKEPLPLFSTPTASNATKGPPGLLKSSEGKSSYNASQGFGAQDKKKKQGKGNFPIQEHSFKSSKTEKANEDKGAKKKPRFVNLYSQEGQAKDIVLLPGRHPCTCEASKHVLINNCLKCGRIVCSQEGAGPCLFCGSLVCTPEQQEQLDRGSKRSDKLRDHLKKQTISQEVEAALAKRDKLLEYDKSSDRITKVIDDESDYYQHTSVWLSPEERAKMKKREEELHAQQHGSRLDKKFTLDFAGRCVIEDESELPINPLHDPVLMEIEKTMRSNYSSTSCKDSSANQIYPQMEVRFVGTDSASDHHSHGRFFPDKSRIQDGSLQEMSDNGMCLAMHQPWASLLVAGLKKHEGRSWYTGHRGVLWISAASKQPNANEIHAEEMLIREQLGHPKGLKFPKDYPVGCLLGCVNVTDCLEQADYRDQYPDGPSFEPFVFICEHPRRLPLFFPIRNQHKIFKLDTKLHQAAKMSLKRIAKLEAEKKEEEE